MKKIIFLFSIIILFLLLPISGFAQASYRFIVKGVSQDLLDNINSRINIEKAPLGDHPTSMQLENFTQRLPSIIQRAIEPYGYFKSTVRVRLVQSKQTSQIYITIKIGPPVMITAIHIQLSGPGRNDKKFKLFLQQLPLQKGDRFRVDFYDKIKATLFEIANSQGYIRANLEEGKVYIDREKNQARINLYFNTGERYYFGKVTIDSGPYSDSFIRRFINFKNDMPFSSEKLVKLQQDMANSYYFDQVTITPDLKNLKYHQVPIHIAVTAPKAKKFTLGLGYGTFTGVRLTAGMTLRRIGDEGQHLSSQLKLSEVTSGLAVKYYIPGKNPLTDQWILGGNYQFFHPQNGQSNSATLTGGYSKQLNKLQLNGNLNYLVDRYRVFDPDTGVTTQSYFSKLLYPNLNLNYTDADDLINPSYGRYAMLNLQTASQDVFSTVNFMQGEAKGKALFSPTSFSKIILRGDIGYTVTEDIQQLPLSMRFFAGGLNSIRGYKDSSIGPGRYLVIGSIEYQNHLYGNWDGALFYDVGNAMNHWGGKLNRGQGYGLIYRSLIGPIKVYVGRAMTKKGKPHSIELSIGPEF